MLTQQVTLPLEPLFWTQFLASRTVGGRCRLRAAVLGDSAGFVGLRCTVTSAGRSRFLNKMGGDEAALGAPTLGRASALRWPRAPRDPALRAPRGGRTARRSAEGLWPLSAPRAALGTGAPGPEKPRRGAPFCARLLILLPGGEGGPALPGAQPCTPEGPVSPLPRGAVPAPPAPAPSPPWPGLRSPLGSEARRPRTPRGRTRPTPTVPAARSR